EPAPAEGRLMKWTWAQLVLIILAEIIVLASCSVRATPAEHPRECLSWSFFDDASKGSFSLISWVGLGRPEEFAEREALSPSECTVGDVKVVAKPEPGDLLGSFAEVSS